MKNLKWAQVVLLALLILLPKQISAYQKKVLLSPTRNYTIHGRIVDSFTNLPISNVKLTLLSADSTVIDTCRTFIWNDKAVHPDSYFYMQKNLSEGKYIFKIEHPDYFTTFVDKELLFKSRNTSIDMRDIPIKRKGMENKEHMLGEIVVKSTKIKMVMKGDTIIYNADAFNLPQGSMLDALIRQLPGATLNSNGEIFINGRKLDYLTLNGKDFFKGNNKQLIENLPNYTVKNLKVFEKSTDRSQAMGVDIDKKDYIMDISLKKKYEKTFIANLDIAGGTNSRYATKAFGLYFTPRLQLSIFSNINNVNEDRKPGEKGDWDPTKLPNGQVIQRTVGLNAAVSNEKNTLENNMSTSFTWRDTHNISQIIAESFLTGGNNFNRSISDVKSKNFIYDFQNNLKISTPIFLKSTISLSYNKFDNWGTVRSARFNADPSTIGSTEAILDTIFSSSRNRLVNDFGVNRLSSKTYGFGHSLTTFANVNAYKQLPSGDRISALIEGDYLNTTNSMFNNYQLKYLKRNAINDYRNRYDNTPSYSYNYRLGPQYTFVIPNGFRLFTGYQYQQKGSYRNNQKYRLDKLYKWQEENHALGSLPSSRDSLLLSLDANNSYKGYYISKQNSVSLGFGCSKSKNHNNVFFNTNVSIGYKSEKLDYRNSLLNTSVKQYNWVSGLSLNMGFTINKYSFYGTITSKMETPDLYSKITRSDNSNPLAISLGNPNLKNSRKTNVSLTFSDNNNRRFKLPMAFINININQNAVANGFTYNPTTGVYTYKPQNVKGNWYGNIGLYDTFPLDNKNNFTLVNAIVYSYNHNVDFTGVTGQTESMLSKVNNHWLEDNLSLNYQKGGLTCSLVGEMKWRYAYSRRENFSTIRTLDFNYGMLGSYKFKFGLETGMDLKMFSRQGYSDPLINANDLICNVYISKSFLKEKLAAKLEGYDIFHQLKSISYEIDGQGKSETRFNAIPNYLMLHLIYKMNISGKK
ncbi:hypothetical protein J5A68_12895 [Prevotella melaninogenica]|uniref:hypothetical protein n=1 Tax=Prevotella melaninogenica TaxID=28132 RepID=UPI001BACB483|nr:hypothetical protein J5A68_12895 [Prevotella melaninogenica]